ncbi:hypothetical protein EHQ62_17090 [Leptospira jelokensis]|uniref:Uncharacterized protein n=1 Tax=Leptospira jelokensis TaxID=2484931 RepID=A0A4Z0ZWR2_9LEPT|nr:hypothetical protein EHQ62_17090 [Leptospira jelokensis]
MTPPSGPTFGAFGGHWVGEIGNTRYDVFPTGSYIVGNEWHSVISQVDLGSNVTDCGQCGSSPGFGDPVEINIPPFGGDYAACCDFGVGCTSCPDGWVFDRRERAFPLCYLFCRPPIAVCNTCYIPDWKTTYRRYKYEFLQWTILGEYTVNGRFFN